MPETEVKERARIKVTEGVKSELARRSELLERTVRETSPERVSASQQELLDKYEESGVLDIFRGAAQALSETFPDTELRISRPTGNPTDEMVIALNYLFEQRAEADNETVFHQIYGYLTDGHTSNAVLHIATGAIPSVGESHSDLSLRLSGDMNNILTTGALMDINNAIVNAVRTPSATQVPLSEPRQFQLIPIPHSA